VSTHKYSDKIAISNIEKVDFYKLLSSIYRHLSSLSFFHDIVTCTPEETRYSVTARPQLRKEALLGNGWPQQYQGRVFCGVRSQAINPRERSSSIEIVERHIVIENRDHY
jgi:hypothetical protein